MHSEEFLLSCEFWYQNQMCLSHMKAKIPCEFWVWVDALRPRSTARVMSGRSVILFTLFLGKPPRGR